MFFTHRRPICDRRFYNGTGLRRKLWSTLFNLQLLWSIWRPQACRSQEGANINSSSKWMLEEFFNGFFSIRCFYYILCALYYTNYYNYFRITLIKLFVIIVMWSFVIIFICFYMISLWIKFNLFGRFFFWMHRSVQIFRFL